MLDYRCCLFWLLSIYIYSEIHLYEMLPLLCMISQQQLMHTIISAWQTSQKWVLVLEYNFNILSFIVITYLVFPTCYAISVSMWQVLFLAKSVNSSNFNWKIICKRWAHFFVSHRTVTSNSYLVSMVIISILFCSS